MPVYVYRNLTTGETFEVEQRMIEPALVADPVTGDPVKRLIQPVGIAFKGSGFYVTDSRSKSNGRTTPASTDAKGDSAVASDATPAATKSEKSEKGTTSPSDTSAASAPSSPAPKAKAATVSGGAAD
jgi:predicted nucleic acid-binding Zn ribbon protein